MYFGKKGEQYPLEIYKTLSKKEQEGFIKIDDKIMFDLVNEANEKQMEIVIGNDGLPKLQKIIIPKHDIIRQRINEYQIYINETNYVMMNYLMLGKEEQLIYLEETSDKFGVTHQDISDRRTEAKIKINELRKSIGGTI